MEKTFRYIVSCEPAFRSKAVENFNFLISAEDYKGAWINARAALRYGSEIQIVSFEGENYRDFKLVETKNAAAGQFTVRKVFALEPRHETKRKAELTVAQLVAAAETKKVPLSKKLVELISEMLGGKEISSNLPSDYFNQAEAEGEIENNK